MDNEVKFCDIFRCDMSPGKRYYRRIPNYWQPRSLDVVTMESREEPGVKLEMAQTDFEKLMEAASEGMLHQHFRHVHPAAQELYEKYMAMYLLTRNYDK